MSTAGRVARNTFWNWAGVAAATLVVLFLTPFLVKRLGDERFGVFDTANRVLVYVNLLTLGMRGAVTRFASKEIAAGNIDGLNRTVSAVTAFHLLIGVVGLAVCVGFGMWAPAFFDITPEYASETRLLFAAIGVNFLLSLMWLTYTGVLVGHQRYDLMNIGHVLRELVRASLVVAVFVWGWATLGGLAAALLAAHLTALLYFFFAGHSQQPGLKVRPHRIDANATRELLGFSVWNGLIQIGNVITFATPVFIVGKTLGMGYVLFYSIPFRLVDQIRVLVAGMANTLAPMAASTLVTGDREHFRNLVIKGTRAAATLCFPIGALLVVFCEPFLSVWVGPEYAWSWAVCAVLMIAMFGRISQAPTLHVLIGGGRIRGLAYVQMGSAVATVVLTIVFVKATSWGVVGVAIGVTIPLFVSHTLFLPWYVARQMKVPVFQYVREAYLWPILSTLPGVGVAILLRWTWPPTGWVVLILESMISLGVIAVLAWHTCLDKSIRERIKAKLGMS